MAVSDSHLVGAQGPVRGFPLYLRRASWILSSTYISEFGPLYVQVLGLFYTTWLLYLVSRGTGDDYMHITKAFGHVAISQLPFHYLLSLKNTKSSPIAWATGLTHERLNPIHRLFGRIVHLFLAIHAVLYLRFFIVMRFLEKRIKDRDVRLGILAFWSFNFLGLLALPVVRRKVYHAVFYQTHVVLSALVLPVLWFHVPYTRWFVGQAVFIYVMGGLSRMASRENVEGLKCESVEGTDLIKVKFFVDRRSALAGAAPGQHVYIVRKGLTGPKTPFTIANVQEPGDNNGKSRVEVMLVLRNMGGPGTSPLAALRSDNHKDATERFRIEGPYGEASQYMPSLLNLASPPNGPILLIAGGIGVTYTLPIYLSLVTSSANRGRTIKFVWLIKTLADATWGIELLLAALREGKTDSLNVEIYVTTSTQSEASDKFEEVTSSGFLRAKGLRGENIGRRPNLRETVDEVFTTSAASPGSVEEVSVFVCGPPGLSSSVRGIVGRWVWRDGRKVSWFEEVFGFGGS
ncbi:hypothetical protein H2200_004728 [Cladophialophora chaetospira]|uniref:FAD-binding FR-type domain-containing protein n=1 Tax=Cladophialophora chaetospira TaxID=386627 RepID=A0AA38XDV5_9EURO|nr:hypothetical protein H2200_004728 [Cladophialophora chaetospira]